MKSLLSFFTSRKTVMLSLALSIMAIVSATDVPLFGAETNQEKARAARQQALAKQRRVIFNDDMYELDRKWSNTAEGFLKGRLKPLAGTHVDAISFSAIEADAPVYDSKVQPIYGDAHDRLPTYWPNFTANIKALIKAGQCPIQIITDFAHANGMESWAGIRMNDVHDSFITSWLSTWKKEHREFWVDSTGVPRNKDQHPLGLFWTSLDFTHKEVRDRKFEIIEEICQRYDIDGVDLNFIRHPVFFSPTMRGEPVTAEELEIMTGLIRRIRRFTDERGLERGRPILLAVIVPDTFQLSRNIGLDVETWIKEDLIDIVVPGLGYAPFSLPVEEFVNVAHKYGVKVYPCINRVAPWGHFDLVPEGHRGVAPNWYAAGADGIYFWNLGTAFDKKTGDELVKIRGQYYKALPELGSPRTLRGKDKLFCVDDPVTQDYYQHTHNPSPLPLELKPGESKKITLVVSDDLQAAARDGSLDYAKLMTKFIGESEQDKLSHHKLSLRLNGQELLDIPVSSSPQLHVSSGSGNITCVRFLEASWVKQGNNVLEATLKEAASDKAVKLIRVHLLVRYKP